MKNSKWIIIGAGAAGLSAAISLARKGAQATLLEQNKQAGKKILVSGNGKCNLTNRHISTESFHSQDHGFVEQVLDGYGYDEVEEFFASMGLPLIEGKDGQMFPLSQQASSVADILEYEAKNKGANIIYECRVSSVEKDGGGFVLQTTVGEMRCDKLVIASGSTAAPQLGGSSSGYEIAKSMGHTLVPRHPSLVQLESDAKWVKRCAGVKVAGVARLYANGEYITERKGDLLFADYGISGLAILDISREVSVRLAEHEYCELSLDLMSSYNKEQLTNMMESFANNSSSKPIELWLNGFVHKKLIHVILEHAKLKAKREQEINRKEINKLVHTIKNLKLPITATHGFKHAEASTGGVDTTEVDPITMESKIVPNLYFGGEVLDVDGDRGGYNFHWAWVCGLRIGNSG